MEGGFGVQVDAVLLFNDLHCEQPIQLLRHAAAAGQEVLIIHWNCGDTPRGTSFDIRPRPEQMVDWGRAAGFERIAASVHRLSWVRSHSQVMSLLRGVK